MSLVFVLLKMVSWIQLLFRYEIRAISSVKRLNISLSIEFGVLIPGNSKRLSYVKVNRSKDYFSSVFAEERHQNPSIEPIIWIQFLLLAIACAAPSLNSSKEISRKHNSLRSLENTKISTVKGQFWRAFHRWCSSIGKLMVYVCRMVFLSPESTLSDRKKDEVASVFSDLRSEPDICSITYGSNVRMSQVKSDFRW